MKQNLQNLQDYIRWEKPYPPGLSTLPTVDFSDVSDPLPTLEIRPHHIDYHAERGCCTCTLRLLNGFEETFITHDKFFSIVEGVKERFNIHKINVYHEYEWEVM